MRFATVLVFAFASLLSACNSLPFHTDLMTDTQLINASCSELVAEETKVGQNSLYMAKDSKNSNLSAALFAAFEGFAQLDTKGAYTPSKAADNFSQEAKVVSNTSAELAKRSALINSLRIRKRC